MPAAQQLPTKLPHFNFACLHVCILHVWLFGGLVVWEFGSRRKLSRTMMQERLVRRRWEVLGIGAFGVVPGN